MKTKASQILVILWMLVWALLFILGAMNKSLTIPILDQFYARMFVAVYGAISVCSWSFVLMNAYKAYAQIIDMKYGIRFPYQSSLARMTHNLQEYAQDSAVSSFVKAIQRASRFQIISALGTALSILLL